MHTARARSARRLVNRVLDFAGMHTARARSARDFKGKEFVGNQEERGRKYREKGRFPRKKCLHFPA